MEVMCDERQRRAPPILDHPARRGHARFTWLLYKPLLSGVEQLVDKVFFDPDVARQHVSMGTEQ
jgi:hypothetical protein